MSTRVVHVNDKIDGAVYIGRAMPRQRLKASPFANAYRIGRDGPRETVLKHYRNDLMQYAHKPSDLLHLLPELRDKPLACWCRHDGEELTPDNQCHGDVIIDVLDRFTDEELRAMGPTEPATEKYCECGGALNTADPDVYRCGDCGAVWPA